MPIFDSGTEQSLIDLTITPLQSWQIISNSDGCRLASTYSNPVAGIYTVPIEDLVAIT